MRASPHRDELLGFLSTRRDEADAERALPVDPRRAEQPATLVLVDAAADVPRSLSAHAALRVLPLSLRLHGRRLRDARASSERLRRLDGARLRQARVELPDAVELAWRLHPNLALNADVLIALGDLLGDASAALQQMLAEHDAEIRELRASRGLPGRLALHRIDCGGAFAVPALHARVLVHELERGRRSADVVALAAKLPHATRQWLLPRTPGQLGDTLQACAQPRLQAWREACSGLTLLNGHPLLYGDADGLRCIARVRGWTRAVDALCAQLRDAMHERAKLQISYDGSIAELAAHPAVDALRAHAARLGVTLNVTHMSVAARVRAGAGTLAVALLDQDG